MLKDYIINHAVMTAFFHHGAAVKVRTKMPDGARVLSVIIVRGQSKGFRVTLMLVFEMVIPFCSAKLNFLLKILTSFPVNITINTDHYIAFYSIFQA